MKLKVLAAALCAAVALCSIPVARAADADVTGLVPTIWWDFETKPAADGLTTANKGSASISFSDEGNKSYVTGTNGWAINTASFTPYSGADGVLSTEGNPITVSAVMTLGTNPNGITLNVRTTAGDLIIRRGATEGSLVIGVGPQASQSSDFLSTTFSDGDSAYHLVSIVAESTGMELYVDGTLVDSTTGFTMWHASGYVSQMQFGGHLDGTKTGETKGGGCIDDLRIYSAALTTDQMKSISAEYGIAAGSFVNVRAIGEPAVGTNSFSTAWNLYLDESYAADAAMVYGTDSSLSSSTTNVLGSSLSAGTYTASLAGLDSGTTYWWKIVASNGVEWAETDAASFRTLDEIVPTDYARRIPAAISGYAGTTTLTNFPVLVKLAAGTPEGFDYADCAEDGADIRFAVPDGTVLPHEIDTWNTNGESLVWVKIPAISGTATAFSMYYGASDPARLPPVNAHDVWTAAGHRAVWHFAADATESAQGLVAATATGTPSYENDGVVGKCWQSAGEAWLQYANEASWSRLGPGSTLTISVWAKHEGSYNFNRILSTMSSWEKPAGYELTVQNSKNQITVGSSGRSQYQKVVSPGPMDEMVYLTAVYNADTYADLYVNGVLQEHKQLNPLVWPTEAMTVACVAGGGNVWNGKLDELRLHAAAESADWVKACYDTMAAPSSFVALSPAELNDFELPRFGALSASDENGVVTFSVALGRPAFGGEVPTSVSVFYGTNGENWTELPLGATNEVGTLTGTASGLMGNARYLWYASASATQDASTKEATSSQQSFVTRALEPAGTYKSFTATVDWDGEPAENVPVLLRISESGITGFDYDEVPESRFEIIDGDGRLLPYEVDTWNTDGESLVWVLLPDYRDGATFTVRYGAPFANTPFPASDVWAGYKGVWHMDSVDPDDSTANGFNGTHKTANLSVVAGKIGSAMNVPRKSEGDGISCGKVIPNPELMDGFTVEGWCRPTKYGDMGDGAAMFGKDAFISIRINSATRVTVTTPGKSDHHMDLASGVLPAVGEWWHYAVTFKPNTANNGLNFYINGQCVKTMDAGDINDKTGTTELFLGRNHWGQAFKGDIDEMRLSTGIRTASEIAAEYHAMADGGALTYTTVESSDTDIPVIGAVSATDSNGSATFSVELERPGCGGAVPTSVSVFYGTDGENWTEFAVGSTNEASTLTATASGFAAGVRYLWYAVATATSGGTPKTTTSKQQSFVARAFDPTGNYKSFTVTVVWDGAPAENLPFLLRISEGGINGFDYDDVTASGLEILDASGRLLPFEIDTWDTNGESLVWVLLPVYENGATVTVRYGAPFANAPLPATDVWTAYVGVWHMNEILEDASTGTHYTPDSSASGWHAYESDEADTVLSPVTTAPGASAHPTPLTGTAMNIAYGAGKSSSSLGGFRVPAAQTSSTTLNGPGFTLSAIVNSQQIANNSRCRVIAFGTGHNDKANCSVGSDKIYCMGSDSHNKTNPKGATGWVYATDVFNSPNSKIYADGVCLSESNEGKPSLASLTLDKGIGLGCFTDGKQCLDGYLDEARIRNAASTADWIAAEYHTMADGAVSFSSVSSSDISAPVLGTPSVASNPDGSFTVSVEVSENTPASIVCLVGETEIAMTTSGASLPATYTATFSQLVSGTHVATVRATATSGTVVSSTCPTAFHVGSLTIVKQSDADEGTLTPGVFRVSRLDADSTGMPAVTFNVAFSGSGLAAIADPGISTATIPAGAAYVDIAVTPVPTDEVDEDSELVLAVSGAQIGQQSTGTLTVLDAGFDLAVRYVATDGNDANSGGTPEAAKRTIAAAIDAVNPVAPLRPCTVHVASGLYPISKPIVVTNAISIIADDPDPARTVVSNTSNGDWWGANRRVFTINHAGAFVANLSMQKGVINGSDSGGNFRIGSAGGTVSNCVVEAGKSNGNNYAAGGYLSGGLVTHTIFRKNNCGSGMGNWQGQHGGVLELYGSSRAENCLLVDNPPSGTVYLSLIGDSAVMRNCTIADTGLSKTNEYCKVFTAIRIDSANATVLNTVIAGVTNTIDGAACPPTGTVANFLNSAFDGDVTGLPEGTVTGTAAEFFKDYANGDYTPKTGGPLVNKVENYEGMAAQDLAGNKRQVGSKIDIGCYEAVSTPLLIIVR